MSHDHARAVEWGAYFFAGIAGLSLATTALWVTILAGLISIILGGFKLHDRVKYGPIHGRE